MLARQLEIIILQVPWVFLPKVYDFMSIFFPLRLFESYYCLYNFTSICAVTDMMLAIILSCTLPRFFSAKVTQLYYTKLGLGPQTAETQDWGFHVVFLWLVDSPPLHPLQIFFSKYPVLFSFLIAFTLLIPLSVSPGLTGFQQKFWTAADSVPTKF